MVSRTSGVKRLLLPSLSEEESEEEEEDCRLFFSFLRRLALAALLGASLLLRFSFFPFLLFFCEAAPLSALAHPT